VGKRWKGFREAGGREGREWGEDKSPAWSSQNLGNTADPRLHAVADLKSESTDGGGVKI